MYEHVACLLRSESLNGYDLTVTFDQTAWPLVWNKFYYSKAIILADAFDPATKTIKGFINMWPFLIDQTVYSPRDAAADRKLPALYMLHERQFKRNIATPNGDDVIYKYRPILPLNQAEQSYETITSRQDKDQFYGFENDLSLLA